MLQVLVQMYLFDLRFAEVHQEIDEIVHPLIGARKLASSQRRNLLRQNCHKIPPGPYIVKQWQEYRLQNSSAGTGLVVQFTGRKPAQPI